MKSMYYCLRWGLSRERNLEGEIVLFHPLCLEVFCLPCSGSPRQWSQGRARNRGSGTCTLQGKSRAMASLIPADTSRQSLGASSVRGLYLGAVVSGEKQGPKGDHDWWVYGMPLPPLINCEIYLSLAGMNSMRRWLSLLGIRRGPAGVGEAPVSAHIFTCFPIHDPRSLLVFLLFPFPDQLLLSLGSLVPLHTLPLSCSVFLLGLFSVFSVSFLLSLPILFFSFLCSPSWWISWPPH